MNKLLVIIPAYNEEKNIEKAIGDVRENAEGCDILVVDDGSSDNTFEICRRLGVFVARHKVNLGLGPAVRTGMKYAMKNGYSYALQFDGDGQHDACAIGRMLSAAVEQGNDITIGSRYVEKSGGTAFKKAGRLLISFCIWMTGGVKISDPTSGMRLYNRRVMERFVRGSHYSPEPDTLAYLIRMGMKAAEIPVVMRERIHGKSYLDAVESIRYMFRMCTSILLIQWFR